MKRSELQQKLIAAARAHPPSDRVPYAFARRVMAHLSARPALDEAALWARALWRGALACVAVMLCLGAVSVFTPKASSDLSQEFETTMLASLDQDSDSASVW